MSYQRHCKHLYQTECLTEILAASIRNVRDVGRAFEYGANICTLPPVVFKKMYKHILTDKGIELFENDWKSTQTV